MSTNERTFRIELHDDNDDPVPLDLETRQLREQLLQLDAVSSVELLRDSEKPPGTMTGELDPVVIGNLLISGTGLVISVITLLHQVKRRVSFSFPCGKGSITFDLDKTVSEQTNQERIEQILAENGCN